MQKISCHLIFSFFLTFLLHSVALSDDPVSQDEINLYSSLLSGYNNKMRPWQLTQIWVSPKLNQIISIDEKSEIMTSSIYLKLYWYDPRLMWDAQNNSLDQILLPAKSIWVPDFIIMNSAETNGFISILDQNLASITPDGLIYLVINIGLLKTRCKLNFYYFPFDVQNCPVVIGSWQYDDTKLILNSNATLLDDSEYKKNQIWQFVDLTYSNISSDSRLYYGFGSDIQFNFILKRMPLNYMLNNIFPCLVLNAVTFIAYFLNFAQQSAISIYFQSTQIKSIQLIKFILGMTIFLTLAIYSVRIASDFPAQGEYIPIISLYFVLGLFFTFISLVWFTYAEYMRTKQRMPACLAQLAKLLRSLSSCRFIKTKNKVISNDTKELDKKEELLSLVSSINYLVVFIMMILSLVSNLVIWLLLLSNEFTF